MSNPAHAMHRVVGAFFKFRALALTGAMVLVVLGFVQIPKTPVSMLPEYTPPVVEVQTEALGLSAAEIEQLVTVPLEADLLNGVAWLEHIRSESIAGLSRIELVFEPGTDIMRARQVVTERLIQAHALPNVSKPPTMIEPVSSTSRVMMIGLSTDELSDIELSVLARWKIRPHLLGVPGVANVSIFGQRDRQVQVRVDPRRLKDNGVTLAQVVETTGNALWVSPLTFIEASSPGTGGFIETPNQRLTVQHISPITDAKGLSRVIVADTGDRRLRLSDVTNVVEDHQPLIGDAVVKGSPALILVIEKSPNASTLEVTEAVEDAMDELESGLPGVKVDTTVYRPADYLHSALSNLAIAFLIGLLLLMFVVGGLLRDWRAAFVSVVTIGLSLTTALVVFNLFDITANAMTLAGLVIALAVLVDDSVVGLHVVRRRLRELHGDADEPTRAEAIVDAFATARRPLMAATLILLAATIPALLLPGLTGTFARPVVIGYAVAVAVSLLVALTLTPAFSLVLPKRPTKEASALVLNLQRRYVDLLARFARSRRPVLAAVAVGAILVLGAFPLAGHDREILPSFRDRELLVQWDGPPGTSQTEMARVVSLAAVELEKVPGVSQVGGQVGRAITSDQVVGVNASELWVSIEDDADYDSTVAAVNDVVSGYPGLTNKLWTYPEARVQEARTGSSGDVVVRVYGQDLATLQAKAEELRKAMAGIDGIVDPKVDHDPVEATVEVEVDLAAAEKNRIKPGDVRRASAILLAGVEAGSLFEDQKVFQVVIWGEPGIRHSLSGVENLLVDRPEGGHVRLGDVASVRIAPNPNVIKRESVSRRVDVVASVKGRDLAEVRADVKDALAGVDFPLETHGVLLENVSVDNSPSRNFWAAGIALALATFLVLQALFGSWRLAALVSLTLPMALAGGALAAGVASGPFTLPAGLAMLAVLAFAVRHAVTLVTDYQEHVRSDGTGVEALATTARDRFAPVLTSALATAAFLLPVLLLGDREGLEVVRSVAVVVLGGLVTATLYVLFLVPALVAQFGAASEAQVSSQPGTPGQRGWSS